MIGPTIGEEKAFNPHEYVDLMNNLNLPIPK
jgi:hypothetical protein